MTEASDLAKFDALVESALAIVHVDLPDMTDEMDEAFRLGFTSGIHYVLRTAKESQLKE